VKPNARRKVETMTNPNTSQRSAVQRVMDAARAARLAFAVSALAVAMRFEPRPQRLASAVGPT
jgi:hypothetical protein